MLFFASANRQTMSGEQGKVDESMREMAAIEALKSEKSEKEVRAGFSSSSSSPSIDLQENMEIVRSFLQSCNPSMERFLPGFVDAGVVGKDDLKWILKMSREERGSWMDRAIGHATTVEERWRLDQAFELQKACTADL